MQKIFPPSGHRKACYAIDNLNNFHLFFAILLRLICFPPRFNCNTFMCSERVYGNFCGQKTAWSWPVSCGNARSTPPLFTLRIIPVSRWTASLSPHYNIRSSRWTSGGWPPLWTGPGSKSARCCVWVAVLFPLDEITCLNTSGRKAAIQTSRQIEHAVSLQIERGIPESGLLPKPFQLSG